MGKLKTNQFLLCNLPDDLNLHDMKEHYAKHKIPITSIRLKKNFLGRLRSARLHCGGHCGNQSVSIEG